MQCAALATLSRASGAVALRVALGLDAQWRHVASDRGRRECHDSATGSSTGASCRCPACSGGAGRGIRSWASPRNALPAGGRWVVPVAESREGLRIGASWELGSGWADTVNTHKVMAFGRVDWLHRRQDVFRGTPVLVGGGN